MSKYDPVYIDEILTSEEAINENFTRISNAFDATVGRSGDGPDFLQKELDMNQQQIKNLGRATSNNDAVNLAQLNEAIFGTPDLSTLLTKGNIGERIYDLAPAEISAGWILSDDVTPPDPSASPNPIADREYPPFDCRRYGILPNGSDMRANIERVLGGGANSLTYCYFPKGNYVVNDGVAFGNAVFVDFEYGAQLTIDLSSIAKNNIDYSLDELHFGVTYADGANSLHFNNLRVNAGSASTAFTTQDATLANIAGLNFSDKNLTGGGTRTPPTLVTFSGETYINQVLCNGMEFDADTRVVMSTFDAGVATGPSTTVGNGEWIVLPSGTGGSDNFHLGVTNLNAYGALNPQNIRQYIYGMNVSVLTPLSSLFNISTGSAVDTTGRVSFNNDLFTSCTMVGTWDGTDAGTGGDPIKVVPASITLQTDEWYRVFIIGNQEGDFTFIIDTSASATNALAHIKGLGFNDYNYYRRVGWIKTDTGAATNLVGFIYDGNSRYILYTPSVDVTNQSTDLYYSTPQNVKLGAPPATQAIITVRHLALGTATPGVVHLTWFREVFQEPATLANLVQNYDETLRTDGSQIYLMQQLIRKTDGLSQIQVLSDSGPALEPDVRLGIRTRGWYDDRAS